MSVAYNETLRNNRLDEITAAVGSAGLLRIYGGARPSSGGTPTGDLLAELVCGSPFASGASGGVLEPTLPADDEDADASGEATWFRVANSGGTFVMDGDVGTDMTLNDVNIVAGGTVSVTSWSITHGNA